MFEIRKENGEYIVGKVSHYSGLFTCYDCFPLLAPAIRFIRKQGGKYRINIAD